MSIGAITATSPSAVFVESQAPPIPTSRTRTSIGASAKATKASTVSSSKKVSGASPTALELGVDEVYERRDLLPRVGDRTVGDRLAVDHDPLREPLEMRAREQAGAQSVRTDEALDHAAGGRLAVRSGDVDDAIRPLRIVEQLEHATGALDAGLNPALALPLQQRRVDAVGPFPVVRSSRCLDPSSPRHGTRLGWRRSRRGRIRRARARRRTDRVPHLRSRVFRDVDAVAVDQHRMVEREGLARDVGCVERRRDGIRVFMASRTAAAGGCGRSRRSRRPCGCPALRG